MQAIYARTPEASPLRRLFDDIFVFDGRTEWVSNRKALFGKDICFDLAKALFEQKPIGNIDNLRAPYRTNMCVYHQHKDKRCYKLAGN